VEDAHKLSGYAGTLNWVLGVTTIYLAQASKIKITPPPLNLYVCIAMFKLQAGENKSMRIVSMHLGKMPLKYWGKVPSPWGPLMLLWRRTPWSGGAAKMAGTSFNVGI